VRSSPPLLLFSPPFSSFLFLECGESSPFFFSHLLRLFAHRYQKPLSPTLSFSRSEHKFARQFPFLFPPPNVLRHFYQKGLVNPFSFFLFLSLRREGVKYFRPPLLFYTSLPPPGFVCGFFNLPFSLPLSLAPPNNRKFRHPFFVVLSNIRQTRSGLFPPLLPPLPLPFHSVRGSFFLSAWVTNYSIQDDQLRPSSPLLLQPRTTPARSPCPSPFFGS